MQSLGTTGTEPPMDQTVIRPETMDLSPYRVFTEN